MAIRVRPEGQLVFDMITSVLDAALAGIGLANLPLDDVEDHLAGGRLVRVLPDWQQVLPAYHLYYPNRRNPSPAFTLLAQALRYHG